MVNYNNLKKDYKDKLDDLTPEEAMSLLESLIKNFYDAYDVYDVEKMKVCHEEIEETMNILESNFSNIRNYVWNTKMYYETSLSQFKFRKSILRDSYHDLKQYIQLCDELESNLIILSSILSTYFFNYSNRDIDGIIGHLLVEHEMEDVCDAKIDEELWDKFGINYFLMGNLDNLIGKVRDNMLELMKIIEENYYSPNGSNEDLDDSISEIKNHVHDLIKDDFYRYQREKGIIDLELGWIDAYQIEYELNKAYGKLKKEIEELFEGNNGFIYLNRSYYALMLEDNPNLKFEDEVIYHPQYNIMETRFIPPEHRKDDKMWEKYYWWKSRT